MKRLTKRLTIVAMILVIGFLAGCSLLSPEIPTLILNAPESGYPPCEVALVASGVTGGQFTFSVEGKTTTQPSNTLTVTVYNLPCTVEVVWESDKGDYQTATARIGLANAGPVIGRPMLNGIKNLWWIHPRAEYIVTFPDACDLEGGDVTLVNVTVYHTGQSSENTVFCPPYTGMNLPEIDLYRVRTGQGDVFNAFLFFSTWNGFSSGAIHLHPEWDSLMEYEPGNTARVQTASLPIQWIAYECTQTSPEGMKPGTTLGWEKKWRGLGISEAVYTELPYPPPSHNLSGYPGRPTVCGPQWPRHIIPSGMTVITATFKDEMGATTTESWSIPTTVFPGC